MALEVKVLPSICRGKSLFDIIKAAGWPIWPLLIASIIAVALIIERLIILRREKIVPTGLLEKVVDAYEKQGASPQMVDVLANRLRCTTPHSAC